MDMVQHQGSTTAMTSGFMTGSVRDLLEQIRDHLLAGLDYQDKLARFLENHDEPRAAATFAWPQHRAAAAITFLSPGLRFFHQGQFEGAQIRVPAHLCRGPIEPSHDNYSQFYGSLLRVMKENEAFRDGAWSRISTSGRMARQPDGGLFRRLRLGRRLRQSSCYRRQLCRESSPVPSEIAVL